MSFEYFKISSGLKNLIGSELITDNYVAVFELVKNSFDANATEVKITFENINTENTKIIIQDNGKGMDYDDLINKWLFVAYSAKKDGTEDNDYRHKLRVERLYAGAKGVGRFSCDRLGKHLNLITIKDEPDSRIENLKVRWSDFEKDQKDEFITIPVEHRVLDSIPYDITNGTILEISDVPYREWGRESLKKLKDRLSKLVRPDLNRTTNDREFKIILNVPDEMDKDVEEKENAEKKNESEGFIYYNTINGEIKNFIFDELDIRTTKISAIVSPDGRSVTTELVDRGEFIYKIDEMNRFHLLADVSITLYFLNRSAKYIFSRKMGIQPVEYGNLFVYKNGFRIYPYGERGDDSFGIDNRALQSYNRYIGLRNLIGQFDIQGLNYGLREATSRDAGLVKTRAFEQLTDSSPFADSLLLMTLRRLEKFVVEVTQWGINDDNYEVKDSAEAKEALVKLVSNIYDDKSLIGLTYNEDIIDILDQKEEKSAKRLLSNFKRVAADSENEQLLKDAEKLEIKIIQQAKALESANREIKQKEELGKELERELEQQIAESLFSKADRTIEKDDLLSVQHHIYRHSAQHITKYLDDLVSAINKDRSKEELLKIVSRISFENKKVVTLSRFVTKAQFDTTVTKITADLISFVNEYVVNVYQEYRHLMVNNQNLVINAFRPKNLQLVTSFRPIEIIIVLDNLMSNALKAKAKKVELAWKDVDVSTVELHIIDDGIGIPAKNKELIFQPRFTTTNGSGLGLYHTRQVIEKMGAEIFVGHLTNNSTEFVIRFKK